ncbi:MAG: biliverdin-producing heme oxygenase [Phycisphaerales bacterium JB054]
MGEQEVAAAVGRPMLAELRERTGELHTQAERHPVQAALVRGQSGVGGYVSYLSQMWHIHAALENELGRRLGSAVLGPVATSQFRAEAIVEDLATFDGAQVEPPVEPVTRFVSAVQDLQDAALLGMHYVLEGSTNGGRFIAMAIRKGLGLEGERGTRYLDPYGEAQKATWGAFCAAMSELSLDAAERERVITGAERMFGLIIETFDAMTEGSTAAS